PPRPLAGTRAGKDLVMTRLKQVTVLAAVGVSALLLSPSRANAGFLTNFTGNTLMRDTPSRSGVVSFTVFQTSGPTANWFTELNAAMGGPLGTNPTFLPGGGASATAAYVYLYQVVNVSTSNGQLDGFKATNSGGYTSAGYFSN